MILQLENHAMIEPITARPLVHSLAWLDLAPITSTPLAAANSADQARFQQALRTPTEHSVATPKTSPAEIRLERPLTPGDAILQSLDKMRSGYRELTVQVESAIRQPDLSPQALLNLQMQVSEVTLSTQLANQVANTVEQHMNSLLKGS